MKLLTILLLLLAYMQASAQSMTEWQIIGDSIYVELANPDGTVVNEIKFISDCDSTFTLTTSFLDDFNKEGAIYVVKFAKTFAIAGCVIRDFSVEFDGKMNGRGNLSECSKGYSVSILDSSFIEKSKYPNLYFAGNWGNGKNQATSFPSIGTPNLLDSSLIRIKGNLSQYANREDPQRNQLFWAFNRMVDAQTGDTILRTDSEGNFEAVSLAQYHGFEDILLIDSSEIGKYSRDNFESSTDWHVAYEEGRVYWVYWGTGLPGELSCNLFRGMHTLVNAVSATRLTLAPNPAKGSVAVGYELPAGTDYRSCSIVLVGADGRVVRDEQLQSASDTKAVQLGGIARGQYSCIIRTDDGIVIGSENLIVE